MCFWEQGNGFQDYFKRTNSKYLGEPRKYLRPRVIRMHFHFGGTEKQSKKDGKDQETIQLSTTPDPGYHTGK